MCFRDLSASLIQLRANVTLAGTVKVRAGQQDILVDLPARRRGGTVRGTSPSLPNPCLIFLPVRALSAIISCAPGEDDAVWIVLISGPVRHAAERCQPALHLVCHPDLFAGLSLFFHHAITGGQKHTMPSTTIGVIS